MSKTHNTKHRFDNTSLIEYPNGFIMEFNGKITKKIENGGEDSYDYTHTTDSDNIDRYRECTRHPNKKRHSVLNKEFSKFGIRKTKNYRNPYGEVDYRSFRLRLNKSTANGKRRAKLKEETYELINSNEL